MKTQIPTTFEELLAGRYSRGDEADQSVTARADELFTSYYGKPLVPKGKKTATALSHHCDNGEVLPQRTRRKRTEEYIVSQSAEMNGAAVEEYVVVKAENREQGTGDRRQDKGEGEKNAPPAPQVWGEQSPDANRFAPIGGGEKPNAASPNGNTAPSTGGDKRAAETPTPNAQRPTPDASTPQRPNDLFGKEVSEAKTTEDDFVADMQAILTGQKVFDPVSKKTVSKEQIGRAQTVQTEQNDQFPPLPPLQSDNNQAIFDRIAQSMTYANAYDLGTVEMETRFDSFDKNLERQQTEAKRKTQQPTPVAAQSVPNSSIGMSDFLQDLDAIQTQARAASVPPTSPPVSNAESVYAPPPAYSRPFYDTGEHVQMGSDLYKDRLHVGRSPGVAFSYGQIIAMADLYRSYEEMMGVDVAELQSVKKLIERSTLYYTSGKANKADDVGDGEWDDATNGRYLPLALDNYEHFSPNLTLLGKAGMSSANKDRNHKEAWEACHRDALIAANEMFLAHPNSSFFPEKPLIINAFGDHFLTDAFAAGHQINKAEMIQIFRTNFYKANSDDLSDVGKAFFEKLADRAWKGNVQKEFSKLETVDTHFAWVYHPSINSASRFADVLVGIAEKAPDEAINLAVKALHDRLNDNGILVTNAAGHQPWRLTGDGTLNSENLAIIRQAVQQSIDNVNEIAQGQHAGSPVNPSLSGGKPAIAFDILFARVWQYTPQLTPASHNTMQQWMREYTDPTSTGLIDAAADILERKVDLLVKKLIDRKILRYEKKSTPPPPIRFRH